MNDNNLKVETSNSVQFGNARFSLLQNGMVRLEFDHEGVFDNRPTFRAITLPKSIPFINVTETSGFVELKSNDLIIKYVKGRMFNSNNLTIEWASNNKTGIWNPGLKDNENLGAISTLDHISREIIPERVHSAGENDNDRLGEINLVSPMIQISKLYDSEPSAFPDSRKSSIGELLKNYDSLSDKLKNIVRPWKHFPPGPVSRAGYWSLDETGMMFYDPSAKWLDKNIRTRYQNIFFGAYGKNYFEAMKQYVTLCGRIPILPRWAFGSWYSCFQNYTENDYKKILSEFDKHNIPVDVFILDMDWHKNGWCGWEWNKNLFPNPAEFFDWAKESGIRIGMNLHDDQIIKSDSHFDKIRKITDGKIPISELDVIREKNCEILDFSNKYVWNAVSKSCYEPNEKIGADFWWLDSWQGKQTGYNHVLWKNHLATEHYSKRGLRPMILGRYSGIGSHRYPAYFSGDTSSHWEVLEHELEVNIKAGQVGMNYFSHDLGGFKGENSEKPSPKINPELFVRWMQMGALSPVMRVHSDHGVREAWKYGEKVLKIVREAYHFHSRITPYFYHTARRSFDTGTPIHLPLYFLFPDDKKAHEIKDQYFIGERIMVAPVAASDGRRKVYIPKAAFFSLHDKKIIAGPKEIEQTFSLDQIPVYVRAGSIIPTQNVTQRTGSAVPESLIFDIYPGGNDFIEFYEDDGMTELYKKSEYSRWPVSLTHHNSTIEVTFNPAEGSFNDMPEQRNITIKIHFIKKPKSVCVNNIEQEWKYNDKEQCAVICLGKIAVRQEHKLTAWV